MRFAVRFEFFFFAPSFMDGPHYCKPLSGLGKSRTRSSINLFSWCMSTTSEQRFLIHRGARVLDANALPLNERLESSNINEPPFRASLRLKGVNQALRTVSLTTKCTSRETLLHFGFQTSHLKYHYYHQDLHQAPFHSGSRLKLHNDARALLLISTAH